MSRFAPTVAKMVLLICAGLLTLTVTAPAGSGELRAQQNFNNFNNQPRAEEFQPAQIIFILVFYGVIIAVAFAIRIFICFLISNAVAAVPPQFRLMEPGMVWLMLIPCFDFVWAFFVYVRVAKSYQYYFRSIGRYDVGDCGESLGLWFCICKCLTLIPCVGGIAGMAAFVIMIIYLVTLYGLKGQIQMGAPQPKWGV